MVEDQAEKELKAIFNKCGFNQPAVEYPIRLFMDVLAWHSQGVGEVHEHKFVTSSTNMGEWVKVDRYCERCGVDYKDLTGAHHG